MTELPRGWARAKLGDVADVLDHLRVPVNRVERAERVGDVPYYGATGQVGWIDDALFDEELCLLGEDGAPFFDSSKPKAYVIDGPSWVNNHAHVLRARGVVTTNRFLKYALDQIDYRSFITGTTRGKLTKSAMVSMPIALAPLAEQRRIVAAIEEQFSRLDAAEATLRTALKRVAWLREGAFEAGATDTRRRRLAELIREPLRNGHSAKGTRDGTGVRTLTLTAVTRDDFSERNTKLTVADRERVNDLWLEPGDVLIERSNTPELVGTAAMYDGPRDWAIFPDLLIRVRTNDDLLPAYLEFTLRSRRARSYFKERAQGIAGSMPKIDQGAVAAFELALPPLEHQRRIVAELEQQLSLIDSLRATVESTQKRSAALRRAILERAFRGELVPQHPADEPASILLERIRAERAAAPATRRRGRGTILSS